MKLTLIHCTNLSIFQQLQMEEALLRTSDQNFCLLNAGSTPSVVMGISGNESALLTPEFFAQDAVALIRRFSGGGTVLVDENTFFATFIFNKSDLNFNAYPEPLMRFVEGPVRAALENVKLKENDFVIGNKKCGGNAQMLTSKRALHHISFLWDFNPENMRLLSQPQKMPAYRKHRSHLDFLTPICHHYPEFESVDDLLRHFKLATERYFEIDAILHIDGCRSEGKKHIEAWLSREHRSATHLIRQGKISLQYSEM